MAGKHYQDADVHAATLSRLRLVFRNFERVCVAFSGGKDSSVTLQLALDVARELGRSPVDVLFIDLEGQYQATIDHVSEMLGRPDVRPWWVCLPLNLRNASSLEEPYWCCWEPGAEADWVRPLPKHPGVISDPGFFPFYRYRMEFEEFVAGFNAWLSREEPTAFLVGIRSDESLNRYLAVKRRSRAKQCAWTPPGGSAPLAWSARDRANPQAVSFFPIYDWRFEDLWRCVADHGYAYNRLYDQMYRAGVPFSQMRICQPYGDD
ncbi:phosphoadenosine phosphosulfate reductase family protein, partial [Pseudomonas aeruginosa]|nr:phosphoadenosine phosphosulfate reductase family protein [Pseudomonas aeruginosa]